MAMIGEIPPHWLGLVESISFRLDAEYWLMVLKHADAAHGNDPTRLTDDQVRQSILAVNLEIERLRESAKQKLLQARALEIEARDILRQLPTSARRM